jgi:hypothetical protein
VWEFELIFVPARIPSFREELADVGECFELKGIACRIKEEHVM